MLKVVHRALHVHLNLNQGCGVWNAVAWKRWKDPHKRCNWHKVLLQMLNLLECLVIRPASTSSDFIKNWTGGLDFLKLFFFSSSAFCRETPVQPPRLDLYYHYSFDIPVQLCSRVMSSRTLDLYEEPLKLPKTCGKTATLTLRSFYFLWFTLN